MKIMSNILISIVVCLLTLDAVLTCCADGWLPYQGSCYFFGHDDRTFQEAQHFCEHLKADLVNIETAAENTFLRSYLSGLKASNHWIGLTDTMIEDVWTLYPSEASTTYFDWGSGQPNNGKASNCAAIFESFDYHWVDEPCTHSFRALCEKPAEAETIVG